MKHTFTLVVLSYQSISQRPGLTPLVVPEDERPLRATYDETTFPTSERFSNFDKEAVRAASVSRLSGGAGLSGMRDEPEEDAGVAVAVVWRRLEGGVTEGRFRLEFVCGAARLLGVSNCDGVA